MAEVANTLAARVKTHLVALLKTVCLSRLSLKEKIHELMRMFKGVYPAMLFDDEFRTAHFQNRLFHLPGRVFANIHANKWNSCTALSFTKKGREMWGPVDEKKPEKKSR